MQGCFVRGLIKKGLLTGSVCGFVLVLWIFCGQLYVDTSRQSMLPISTENCIIANASFELISGEEHEDVTYLYTTQNADHLLYTVTSTNMEYNIKYSMIGRIIVWIYRISFLWYVPLGLLTFLITSSAMSLCTGPKHIKNIDDRLILSCFRNKDRGNNQGKEDPCEKSPTSEFITLDEKNVQYIYRYSKWVTIKL